jgi:hypothetical protein
MKIEQQYGNIYLVEKKPENTVAELKAIFPSKRICVCDFYVSGSEDGEIDENGVTSYSDLLVVDHHIPAPCYVSWKITSTVIANKFVSINGSLTDEYVIVVNHTDTDSILSSLIMSGILKPETEYYDQAAIAADHTGKENIISDLLQSFEGDRNLKASIEMLLKIQENRLWVRKEMKIRIANNEFEMNDGIAFIKINQKIDACLVVDVLPDAKVIVVASPMPKKSKGKWRIRVRLGKSGNGIQLNKLNLPDTGGRWNAVSTSRNDGTDIEPEEYVKTVRNRIEQSNSIHDT